jgi:hypothetical protein
MAFSQIYLNNFYGIEIDDFAHEIAKLSLWLAEHQMNMVFEKAFGRTMPALPLKDAGKIVCANACRIDWEQVCPKQPEDEIYILGNPPYLGFNERKKLGTTNEDMEVVFAKIGNVKRLDYISCWFKLATDYINDTVNKYAFVSTNSICQGEQVAMLWPYILNNNQEIFFAHQSFKWGNNAKSNAGVTCVIIGIQMQSTSTKYIFQNNQFIISTNISPYLTNNKITCISPRTESISCLPNMILGSSPIDGGNLMLSVEEAANILSNYPEAKNFIKPYVGGENLLHRSKRFCLWIEEDDLKTALSIPQIKIQIMKCRDYRATGGRDAQKGIHFPHRFFYKKYQPYESLAIPMTSTENNLYIPVSHLTENTVPSNGVCVIYNPQIIHYGILSSKMHYLWLQVVTGRLKTDYRYSVNLAYNTFPFPNISEEQKKLLEFHVFNVLDERERHSEKTLAELYHKDNMPAALREAHHNLDIAIEQCYRLKPFASDEERLEYLFALYEQMTSTGGKYMKELI